MSNRSREFVAFAQDDRFVCRRGVVKSIVNTDNAASRDFFIDFKSIFYFFLYFYDAVAVASQLFELGSVILFKLANELHLQTPYTVSFYFITIYFDVRRRRTKFNTSKRRFLQAYLSILV